MEIFILLIILFITFYVIIKHKRAALKEFPTSWGKLLDGNVSFYHALSQLNKKKFQKRVLAFLNEVHIDSVDFELNDLDKLFIASSAVIPVFGFSDWHYSNLTGIIVYPDSFNKDLNFDPEAKSKSIMGLIGTGRFEQQMILSRKALYNGFRKKSSKHQNTGIHEFTNLVDKMDGETDGLPKELIEHQYAIPWLKLMHKEMHRINSDHSDIRKYGGTSEAEFFAVAAEYFFKAPERMKKRHSELYLMLTRCFQQDLLQKKRAKNY